MRETKTNRKLHLGREIIATLQSVELGGVNGGVQNTGCVSGCTQCPGDRTATIGPPKIATIVDCPVPGTEIFTGNRPPR
jgi:hypothetical protein